MPTWSLRLILTSSDAVALAASLATETEVISSDSKIDIRLCEGSAADLRAMWNTRMRSLQAADSVLATLASYDS